MQKKDNKIKDNTVCPSSYNKPIVVYTNKEENAKKTTTLAHLGIIVILLLY